MSASILQPRVSCSQLGLSFIIINIVIIITFISSVFFFLFLHCRRYRLPCYHFLLRLHRHHRYLCCRSNCRGFISFDGIVIIGRPYYYLRVKVPSFKLVCFRQYAAKSGRTVRFLGFDSYLLKKKKDLKATIFCFVVTCSFFFKF